MNRGWKFLNAPIPKRYFYFSAGVLVVFILGYRAGTSVRDEKWSRVVAMQRVYFNHLKNPRYTNQPVPAMAAITLEEATNGYRAWVEVEMIYPDKRSGRGWGLGVAATQDEALEKWGLVEWKDDGICAGRISKQLIVERKELESGGR